MCCSPRLRQGKTHEGLHALLWPVARLLVNYVQAHTPQFQGARVLELGAGVGLSGIGAAAYGSHAVLTDKVSEEQSRQPVSGSAC